MFKHILTFTLKNTSAAAQTWFWQTLCCMPRAPGGSWVAAWFLGRSEWKTMPFKLCTDPKYFWFC